MDGGDHAERDAEEDREQDAAGGEDQGVGQNFGDLGEDRPTRPERVAEVPADDVPQVREVLHDQRLVEPELLVKRGDALRRGELPEDQDGRIAGDDPQQEEEDGEDREGGDGNADDSPEKIERHRRCWASRAAAGVRAIPPVTLPQMTSR